MQLPLLERKGILKNLFRPRQSFLEIVHYDELDFSKNTPSATLQLQTLFNRSLSLCHEGLIIKIANSKYYPGYCGYRGSWFKLKKDYIPGYAVKMVEVLMRLLLAVV